MNLVVNQVTQLQDVSLTTGDRLTETLARAAIIEPGLTSTRKLRNHIHTEMFAILLLIDVHQVAVSFNNYVRNFFLGSTVEYRRCYVDRTFYDFIGVLFVRPAPKCCPTKMVFKQLTNIHTRRYTQRIQDNVNWRTVCQVRHVLNRQNARNNTLVTMTTRKLVALLNLTLLSNKNANEFVNTRC